MDDLLDERIIITLMRSFQDFLSQSSEIEATVEAYGPSKNEGLCYESCSQIDYTGDEKGQIFIGFDGYTRLKLIPILIEKYRDSITGNIDAVGLISYFISIYLDEFIQELTEAEIRLKISQPIDCSHKIKEIDLKRMREYILIFFLRDRLRKKYLGRAYVIFTISKFNDLS